MNSCCHDGRSRGFTLLLVIALIAMTGLTAVLLSSHFSTVYRHVRMKTDEAQARQLLASADRWLRLHRSDVLAAQADEISLPIPPPLNATLRIIRAADKSAATVEAIVHRASHKTILRCDIPLSN